MCVLVLAAACAPAPEPPLSSPPGVDASVSPSEDGLTSRVAPSSEQGSDSVEQADSSANGQLSGILDVSRSVERGLAEAVNETGPVVAVVEASESAGVAASRAERTREYPTFVEGPAPRWPFRGLVQLWPVLGYVQQQEHWVQRVDWTLRYWSWEAAESYRQVALPGLEIACLGEVALAVHGERGVEVGGRPLAASGTYLVPWGGVAARVGEASGELAASGRAGPSNVEVMSEGDWVRVGSGPGARSYAMRSPAREAGALWDTVARHDGELFLMTVHPKHLRCYSGVSWLSVADTGELVMCGANSAATAFVAPEAPERGGLVLPDPSEVGSYVGCAPQLELRYLPFQLRPAPCRTVSWLVAGGGWHRVQGERRVGLAAVGWDPRLGLASGGREPPLYLV